MKCKFFVAAVALTIATCGLMYAKASGTTRTKTLDHVFGSTGWGTPAHEITTISLDDYNADVWGPDFNVNVNYGIPSGKSLAVTYYNELGYACMRNETNTGVTNSGASVSNSSPSVTTYIYYTNWYTESITVKMKKGYFDTWGSTINVTFTFDMA